MDINKLNHVTEVTQVPDTNQNVQGDGSFKFTLASAITDADLQAKVDMLLSDITAQGNRIAQHMDIRDMKKYRGLIREFMNEVVFRSHKFSRENFLDRRGRHRVYGLIKLIDSISSPDLFWMWIGYTAHAHGGKSGSRKENMKNMCRNEDLYASI